MQTKNTTTRLLAAVALAALAVPASATVESWNTTVGNNTNPAFGNTRSYTGSAGTGMTGSGWSSTGGTSSTTIENAYLAVYNGGYSSGSCNTSTCTGGLGVVNRDGISGTDSTTATDNYESLSSAPEHATDNNERFDSVMFSFGKQTKLTQIGVGYVNTDGDMSVLAYTGAGTPVITGLTYAQLLSNGWTLIGNYNNTAVGEVNVSTTTYASYWIVGAYNSTFGTGTGLDTGNDYFKICGLTGDTRTPPPPPGVPEPASLLLVGLAAGLLAYQQNRSAKRA